MSKSTIKPLPATLVECRDRGWDYVDIILVNGDAYIDHPSFGIALIGRLLESQGYRVAILAQPRFDKEDDFRRFGRPRLFFGISGGNLDSIVANYSGNGKVRDFDAYSLGGNPWRSAQQSKENRYRPDRACLIYTNLARRAYSDTTVILGGVEASLRRFIHYDYKQDRLRGSHLTDAKADLLVYGMGEKAIVEAAKRLEHGHGLENIPGSCVRLNDAAIHQLTHPTELPSWQAIQQDITLFMEAERIIDRQARARSKTVLIQKQQAAWLIQYPAAPPLNPQEMDRLYELPFSRKPHPVTPDIPAHTMIKDSITIVRGCSGNCSFCAISRHQGPTVTSRSIRSIVKEATTIAADDGFGGTISDLGGPTANLFATHCAIGSCKKHDCLFPKVCKNLVIDEATFLELLDKVMLVKGIKHAHVSSGLRLELLRKAPALLEKLLRKHIPGTMKIAPEHTEAEVLKLMHKEPHGQLVKFLAQFNSITHRLGKKTRITPYIISAHPGCTEMHTRNMVKKLKQLGLSIRQFQDFTPTPGTLSTAMYVSQIHCDTGNPIEVARNQAERNRQRRLIERAFFQKNTSRQKGSKR